MFFLQRKHLDKSKFEAVTVEHDQDAYVRHQGA